MSATDSAVRTLLSSKTIGTTKLINSLKNASEKSLTNLSGKPSE